MINFAINIDRPVDTVWEYFTDPANWSKWYGGAVKEVAPGWQEGAKLVWALGGVSEIIQFVAGQEICLSGSWMDTTYRFKPDGSTATLLEVIESNPKGGATFNDGGVAHKAQIETALARLKEAIERESGQASAPQAGQDFIQALAKGPALFIVKLTGPATEISDMQAFDIPDPDQDLVDWVRAQVSLPNAAVATLSPQEWEPPQLKAINSQELNANINNDSLTSIQKAMAKRGLPELYPVELAQNLVAVPTDPKHGKVLLVFRIDLLTRLADLPIKGIYTSFSPDGSKIAIGNALEGKVYFWDMAAGPVQTVAGGEMAFSPDGGTIATSITMSDPGIQIWRISDLSLLWKLPKQTSGEADPKYSPDGSILATADGKVIHLWQAKDGTLLRTIEGNAEGVRCIAFSPDGKLLASGSGDMTVQLWNVIDGTLLRTLQGHTKVVSDVAFTPDGALLASAGHGDQTVRLWRVSDGELVRVISTNHKLVMSLAISPDGRLLATVGDNFIRLWLVQDGTLVRAMQSQDIMVTAVAFSPDGKRLLTSSATGGAVRLWGCWS